MDPPSRAPFCWQLNEHQFKPTPNGTGLYCIHCGTTKPFPPPVQQPRHEPRSTPPKTKTEQTHRKAWAHARLYRVTECFYCRQPFNKDRPPTFDHIVPLSQGGNAGHGVVLACQLCNGARSNAPFMDYVVAVCAEHKAAREGRREYRRPKMRHTSNGWVLTTATRREWRAYRSCAPMSYALFGRAVPK